MNVAIFIYWLLVIILFYAYFGYGILAWMATLVGRKKKKTVVAPLPALTFIIPCYNEEGVIAQKISNTLALDYPAHLLQIIVVNDGSADNTSRLVPDFDRITLIDHERRKGKSAALNTAMEQVETDLVFFSDANALLNREALKQMLPHFNDLTVGGVAGEKKISKAPDIGNAEGWYWQYESFLKGIDAAFYSVIGATGEVFAMRTSLYTPIDEDVLLDDFFLSMHICQQGFVIAYEPGAYATEKPSTSLTEEYHRKVRIASGAFQSFRYISFKKLVRFPRLLFQVFSRRWLRWIACPVAIPLLFLLNAIIILSGGGPVYIFLLLLQVVGYSSAGVGGYSRHSRSDNLFALPFYFLFMNYCMLAGFWVFLNKQQTVFWSKAERS